MLVGYLSIDSFLNSNKFQSDNRDLTLNWNWNYI